MADSPVKPALRPALRSLLQRAWLEHGLPSRLLQPLSWIYLVLVWLRRQLYRYGLFKTQGVDALVIVIGNVVAGGAGKTPTVIALVQHLQAQQHHVGVISRGYGRIGNACIDVLAHARPQDVGDEPLLIRRATKAPVFVGRTRHEAAIALLAAYPETRIIVCDDGLQHYGLYRDLEICVFDDRGCGNGRLLPAGPLRESWPRQAVARAGQRNDRLLVLHTGGHPAFAGYTAQRKLAPFGVRRDGTKVLLSALCDPDIKPLAAVAGIAQPESFFSMLRALNLPLAQTIALPDHYHFNSEYISIGEGYRVICTEKDAVKLWRLVPDAFAIPLNLTPEPAFFAALDAFIAQRLGAKLSSDYGHKTS